MQEIVDTEGLTKQAEGRNLSVFLTKKVRKHGIYYLLHNSSMEIMQILCSWLFFITAYENFILNIEN